MSSHKSRPTRSSWPDTFKVWKLISMSSERSSDVPLSSMTISAWKPNTSHSDRSMHWSIGWLW